MRRSKKLLKFILLAALILSVLCVPAFALDESEVEAAVAASSKEAVTGECSDLVPLCGGLFEGIAED